MAQQAVTDPLDLLRPTQQEAQPDPRQPASKRRSASFSHSQRTSKALVAPPAPLAPMPGSFCSYRKAALGADVPC